jgi:hypothetical protein
VDVNDAPAVGGGVEDAYGEDRATEDQPVTPWTLTVARFVSILLPRVNRPYFSFKKKKQAGAPGFVLGGPEFRPARGLLRAVILPPNVFR